MNAQVIVLGVDDHGFMETPPDAWSVAWYDFSARPGTGGNAVFSGQSLPGPAVFTNLHALVRGDRVEVRLTDGTVIGYAVTSTQEVGPDTNPRPLIGPSASEQVTLIACVFSGPELELTGWLIVKAERH